MLLQNYVGQDDDQTDDEDYRKYYESTMIDQTNPDDLLTPLEKLRKYCTSENIFTRQMVARSIVETVQSICTEQECLSLLEIITKLSDDIEPSVRCELMEQLPPCSIMIMDMKIINDAISTFILPVMVRYLTDANNQVRKLSQNALLQLMDQDLIRKEDVESQICPVILVLTEAESDDDFRTEAVALMTKLTCLLGAELTEKLFLERFGKLCGDALFHVRKVCASNFGELAAVVQRETTEKHLLPLFAHLCEDGVWGVRKACAEAFMAVSGICSKQVRYHTLAPLFVGLLCDKSRWVQMAAYQALGQFIATFADPEKSGFYVTEDGILMLNEDFLSRTFDYDSSVDHKQPALSIEDPSLESDRSLSSTYENSLLSIAKDDTLGESLYSTADSSNTFNTFEYWRLPLPNVDLTTGDTIDASITLPTISSGEAKQLDTNMDLSEKDNTKSPSDDRAPKEESLTPPQESDASTTPTQQGEAVKTYVIINSGSLEKASAEDTKESTEEGVSSNDTGEDSVGMESPDSNIENSESESAEQQPPPQQQNTEQLKGEVSSFGFGLFGFENSDDEHSDEENNSTGQSNSTFTSSSVSMHCQNIVPPALLEHFISMTEPSKANTIDGDLPRHCAYTLPGVVLALGRENWHLVRDTYVDLSTDMQWKVRRTLAFSIHDLALILGQKICVDDLVLVFNQFLKDLDEVRVGVLKHLFDFINILPKQKQKDYLPTFCEFQKTDNSRNWRFRKDLSEQLVSLVELYSETELSEYLCPVALELASDKVADVRENSFNLLCILLRKLYEYEADPNLFHKFVTSIIALGTHNQHWVKRKACAQIYKRCFEMTWYDKAHFSRDFLPSLLTLCSDVVPNVRLISSKSLLSLSKSEYYQCLPEADEVRNHVDRALETLQLDEDRDVRFFSGGKVEERVTSDYETTVPITDDEDEFQNMTLEMGMDDNDAFSYSHGVRIIQRGIHEYAINDDDDDDTELVEEVYIEDSLQGTHAHQDGDIVMEEFYIDDGTATSLDHTNFSTDTNEPYYIEEIVEEIILK